ncbi:hypothetical protein MOSE0_K01640 [Monosporozyma servazzii]
MRSRLVYTLLCISITIATSEIDDIAQEIVSRSQSQIDLSSVWERIEYIQANYPIQSRDIQGPSQWGDSVLMDEESDDMETISNNDNNNNTKRTKMSLIPLKRETLEAMMPDLAIDMAEAYTKYGLFYLDIKQI